MRMRHSLFCLFLLLPGLIISACSQQPSNQASGYIEGRYTYIATSVSGRLMQLDVERGSTVKKGTTLFVLEAQPESDVYTASKNSLEQSIAARDAIAANLSYAKITYQRYKVLVPRDAVAQSQLDNAQSNYNAYIAQLAQANASIASATASLAQSAWTRNQKVIAAPVDAIVFDTYYRIGEYTIADQAILSLLAPQDIKAIFYVYEKVLGSLKLGDAVTGTM